MEQHNEISSRGSPPFSLEEDKWGKLKYFEEVCPGVYSVTTTHCPSHLFCRELYVVSRTAVPAIISTESISYGFESDGYFVFEHEAEGSGWEIVNYEILRYKVKHHIPIDDTESLYSTAIFEADRHPAYFGGHIPPRSTPWGPTLRWKSAAPGIFFIEAKNCEWVLAIAYPIWTIELSEMVIRLGRSCRVDEAVGEEEAIYLYVKRENCAPVIYELLQNSEHDRLFTFIHSQEALETYIYERFIGYVVLHNLNELSGYGNDNFFENLLSELGCEENEEVTEEKLAKRVANCIKYTPDLAGVDYLLLPK